MYTKWLVAVLASIVGLALVNGQSNDTNATSVAPNVANTTVITTTVAPTTTTTTSPTTTTHSTTTLAPTVPPTPPPRPSPESWNGTVKDQNRTCISVKFSIVIDITYNTTNSSLLSTGFIIPTNAFLDESNSYCSVNDTEPEGLGIYFVNEQHTSANLTLIFNRTNDDVWVQSIKLSFNLTRDLFPQFKDTTLYDTIVTFENKDLSLFKVASAHSYVCGAAQSADLGGDQKGIHDVTIDFTESQVEAYIDKSKEGKFDSEIDCKSSEISDVVPIAVGAALAGLVIIVLIAYFIGRRRSRRLAYQSV